MMGSLFPEIELPKPDVLWLPQFLTPEEHEALRVLPR